MSDAAPELRDDAKELIRLLAEYIEFLNNANEGPIVMAALHGWACSQKDIDRGKEFRQRIVELATECGIVLSGW